MLTSTPDLEKPIDAHIYSRSREADFHMLACPLQIQRSRCSHVHSRSRETDAHIYSRSREALSHIYSRPSESTPDVDAHIYSRFRYSDATHRYTPEKLKLILPCIDSRPSRCSNIYSRPREANDPLQIQRSRIFSDILNYYYI